VKNIYYRACGKFLFWDHGYVDLFDFVDKVIYLGHGNPGIKNASAMIKICDTPTDVALTTSEGSRQHTSEMINISSDKLFVCGLPRNDVIFNEKRRWREIIDVKDCKVILWMPTFRKARDGARNDSNQQYLYGLPLIHTISDLDRLNSQLQHLNVTLVIKPHPYAENVEMNNTRMTNIIFLTINEIRKRNINVYCFFDDTDALLTDYSSVAFDYMLVDKPVGYIIDDIDDYKLGFSFKNILEYMPGNHIRNDDEMYDFFEEIANNQDLYKSERRKISQWANIYSDGHNCERIVEIFNL
jgi:CDP-glycerol glycerophosphotransferase (TagB/SpsB family)